MQVSHHHLSQINPPLLLRYIVILSGIEILSFKITFCIGPAYCQSNGSTQYAVIGINHLTLINSIFFHIASRVDHSSLLPTETACSSRQSGELMILYRNGWIYESYVDQLTLLSVCVWIQYMQRYQCCFV